ncbi:hypothetical protein HispidOSU_015443, partial [Sigmodon hispidus]
RSPAPPGELPNGQVTWQKLKVPRQPPINTFEVDLSVLSWIAYDDFNQKGHNQSRMKRPSRHMKAVCKRYWIQHQEIKAYPEKVEFVSFKFLALTEDREACHELQSSVEKVNPKQVTEACGFTNIGCVGISSSRATAR